MVIIKRHLIDEISKIISGRVPSGVFKINKHHIFIIFQLDQDITLMRIIMPKHYAVLPRHQRTKMISKPMEQKVPINRIDSLQRMRMRNTVILQQLASVTRQLFFQSGSPLLNPLVDEHVVQTSGCDCFKFFVGLRVEVESDELFNVDAGQGG